MAGTKAGGLKAAATNKAKYGEGFYARIGRMGGAKRSHRRFCGKSGTSKISRCERWAKVSPWAIAKGGLV